MNLQLSLKTEYFELTKTVKSEDYREITAYWAKRLLKDFFNDERSQKWWQREYFETGTNEEIVENLILTTRFKHFTTNTMTLGYPKSTNKERILKFEHAGIEIRTGNEAWGAEPNKLYFVIKHGKKL